MQRMELLRTAKLIFVFRCDMMSAQLAFFRRESFMQKGLNLTVGGGCDPLDIILSFDKIVESFEARLLKRVLKSELSQRQNWVYNGNLQSSETDFFSVHYVYSEPTQKGWEENR